MVRHPSQSPPGNFLLELTKTAFKVRNEGSYLGLLWYLLEPFLLFCVLVTVFSQRLGQSIEHYPFYLLTGLLFWNYFSSSTARSITVIAANAKLIKTLNIRREMLVVSGVLLATVTHLIEVLLLTMILLVYGFQPVHALLFPGLFVLEFLWVLGTAFLVSAFYVHVRDIQNMWTFVSRAWWFATPIFYALHTTDGWLYAFNQWNPMYHIITIARDLFLYAQLPSSESILILSGQAVVVCVIGYTVFRAKQHTFAELL